MKFQEGDKVKFQESSALGPKMEYTGTIIIGLHDETLSDEPYYLVDMSGKQVMKDESELERA